jgi:hypothetical protein
MKINSIILKTIVICIVLFTGFGVRTQPTVNGEIIADTNNLVVIKLWGTHAERGYAHGYLIGDQITDIVQGYIIPSFGSDYPEARNLVSNGQDLIIDSLYQVEAKSMIDGMNDAGLNPTNLDYIDILVGNCWSDLEGFFTKKNGGGVGCSCLLNWGEGTSNSFLFGKSIIARFYDWGGSIPAIINNAAMIIHMPSEPGLQPWLIVGYAGEMVPSGGGVNQGGLSMYKNAMSDFACSAVPGTQYAPYQFTMRKILETDDFNGDGVHNTQDARDGFDANPQGYPVDKIIPVIARNEGNSDSLTAMVAEIAPVAPTHVYRTNSYDDMIPGANLYAANRQIKRNNAQNYCPRYINVSYNFGDSTNFGIQKNYDIMVNYSNHITQNNYGFIQHIPELDILKVSVFRDNTNAYQLPMTSFDLREFFNRDPVFISLPVDTARVTEEYTYLLEVSDPDPYDVITFSAEQIPDWLTLTDNGDGTAFLQGIPQYPGADSVIIKASDGMVEISQEFEISIDESTTISEPSEIIFSMHPNPFKDGINISIENPVQLIVYTLNGRVVFQEKVSTECAWINLDFLSQGVYILVLNDGLKAASRKIIKN